MNESSTVACIQYPVVVEKYAALLTLVGYILPSYSFVVPLMLPVKCVHSWINMQKVMSRKNFLLSYRANLNSRVVNIKHNTISVFLGELEEKEFLNDLANSSVILFLTQSPEKYHIPPDIPHSTTILLATFQGELIHLCHAKRDTMASPTYFTPLAVSNSSSPDAYRLTGPGVLDMALYANMTEVNITIGVRMPSNETSSELLLQRFARSRTFLFWYHLIQHFHFRTHVLFARTPLDKEVFNDIKNNIAIIERDRADFIGELLLISSERVAKFGFVLLGLSYKYHLIVSRPETAYSWMGVTKPFEATVWITILVFVIGSSFLYFYITNHSPNSLSNIDIVSSVVVVFGFSCNQANLGTIKSLSIQIACLSALFLFTIMNQFYISNLYSILSTPEVKYPFRSIEEFIEKKTHKFAIHPDTSIYSALQASKSGVLRDIYETFIKDDPGHAINETNVREVIAEICSGKTALLALPIQMLGYKRYCAMQALPPGYFPNQMGLAANKKFPYLRNFRAYFLRAAEVGVTSYLKKKYEQDLAPLLKKTEFSIEPQPITMEQTFLLFAWFLIFCLLSILLLIIEICDHRKNGRVAHPAI